MVEPSDREQIRLDPVFLPFYCLGYLLLYLFLLFIIGYGAMSYRHGVIIVV